MIPFQTKYDNTNNGRGGLTAFDLPYAYQDLNSELIEESRSVWKTPLWLNLMTGGLAGILGWILWLAYQHDPLSHQTVLIVKILLVVVGLLFFGAAFFLAIFSLARGRLVLDKDLRELRFYRFWFSLRHHRQLRIDDIEALVHKTVCSSGDNHEPGRDYDVLVGKLKDGRLASIAINSPYSIEKELKIALGRSVVSH